MKRLLTIIVIIIAYLMVNYTVWTNQSVAQSIFNDKQSVQNSANSEVKPVYIKEPVMIGSEVLFYIAGNDLLSAKTRSKSIVNNLKRALMSADKPVRVSIVRNDGKYSLYLNGKCLVNITPEDAKVNDKREKRLAKTWKANIDAVARNYKIRKNSEQVGKITLEIVLAIIMALVILGIIEFTRNKLGKLITKTANARLESFNAMIIEGKNKNEPAMSSEEIESSKSELVEKISLIAGEIKKLLALGARIIQIITILILINFILYEIPATNNYFSHLINFEISLIEVLQQNLYDRIHAKTTWEGIVKIITVIICLVISLKVVVTTATAIENILVTVIKSSNQKERRIHTLSKVIITTIEIILIITGLLIILNELGINVTPIIAGAGIVGLAISFGAQSLVKDVINGFFILMEDQFGIGDVVDIDGYTGTVENMTLRVTTLRDISGKALIIPNGQITKVAVLTKEWSRANIEINISYNNDLNKAIEILKSTAEKLKQDYPDKIISEPQILAIDRFTDTSIRLRVLMDTTPGDQWMLEREFRVRLKSIFEENQITLVNQQIIYVPNEPK